MPPRKWGGGGGSLRQFVTVMTISPWRGVETVIPMKLVCLKYKEYWNIFCKKTEKRLKKWEELRYNKKTTYKNSWFEHDVWLLNRVIIKGILLERRGVQWGWKMRVWIDCAFHFVWLRMCGATCFAQYLWECVLPCFLSWTCFYQNKRVFGSYRNWFYILEKIGGIEYYPSSNWSDFYQYDPGDGDTDAGTFLQEQGILHPDETLDAYMFEIGTNDQSADLWESRSDIKREHFFVFTESGHCYDLWFYCDALDDSEKETIRESFQLQLSIWLSYCNA